MFTKKSNKLGAITNTIIERDRSIKDVPNIILKLYTCPIVSCSDCCRTRLNYTEGLRRGLQLLPSPRILPGSDAKPVEKVTD